MSIKNYEWCKLLAKPASLLTVGAAIAITLSACNLNGDSKKTTTQPTDRSKLTGEELFSQPFPEAKNQRSCATCHVPEDSFTLTPAHVAKVFAENPDDALFSAIDADDPNADPLTFEHLKKGLIRVWITLPENVDQIDAVGNVITPSNRKVFVWRSVPSIADVAMTAPYQLDGRVATLEEQAQGAINGHSEGVTAPESELKRIAEFQSTTFTSDLAKGVAALLESGVAAKDIPNAEDALVLTAEEARGEKIFEAVCAGCHGGVNKATIVDREIHDLAFPELFTATEPPTPVLADNSKNEFINIGSSFETYLSKISATEHFSFVQDISLPQYRLRFYTDATRTKLVIDLPVATDFDADAEGGGFDGGEDDSDVEITNAPQLYSTDPGRALITGNPYDFEGFDIPTLRGISKTAPYFHDNMSVKLEDVIELYSDHLLSKFPSLTQPGEKEPDDDGDVGPEETLTRQHKDDLLAYLKRI